MARARAVGAFCLGGSPPPGLLPGGGAGGARGAGGAGGRPPARSCARLPRAWRPVLAIEAPHARTRARMH